MHRDDMSVEHFPRSLFRSVARTEAASHGFGVGYMAPLVNALINLRLKRSGKFVNQQHVIRYTDDDIVKQSY